jgi:hypothetical protein
MVLDCAFAGTAAAHASSATEASMDIRIVVVIARNLPNGSVEIVEPSRSENILQG